MRSFFSAEETSAGASSPASPSIALPKGGGAIRSIGEKFAVSPATGTGTITVPIPLTPGRSGFGPKLSLSYDSGAGNGPFGLGWSLALPTITRRTEKGLPQYADGAESDIFILSGSEDLVPLCDDQGQILDVERDGHLVRRYRPRIEGPFARIERWTNLATGIIHWRTISSDNVTALFGINGQSRIADPADPSARIYSWLIAESHDDRGNAIIYEYADEDNSNVDLAEANERNRTRSANRYLKRIKYGNRVSRLVGPDLSSAEWLFEAVFDYDEDHYRPLLADPNISLDEQHVRIAASVGAGGKWSTRPDPFSIFRPGFELRTYRRCHRVLMFHHIVDPAVNEEGYDGLVGSIELNYDDYPGGGTLPDDELAHPGSTGFISFLTSVTHSGYVRLGLPDEDGPNGSVFGTYLKQSYPPLSFSYSSAELHDELEVLDGSSMADLPRGIDGEYQLADLDGEGLDGVFFEQGPGWYYKKNLGEGSYGAGQAVSPKPTISNLGEPSQQLIDLAGDGQLDLASFAQNSPGFFERAEGGQWSPHRTFQLVPGIDLTRADVRLIDLDGDGRSDIMTCDGDALVWFPSLGEDGFGEPRRVLLADDEEAGPGRLLVERDTSLFLADMCGDGLIDLVRVRNGDVCYWPNLGHGRFGPRIAFDNAPLFDRPDQFDHSRIRLADIDGSGTSDIIYLGGGGATVHLNQAGNRFSPPRLLRSFPQSDFSTSVVAADLFGQGTACLVWSSPLPTDRRSPLRFIDLMGGKKPHLLVGVQNNLGARTSIHYASSTKFYLADQRRGTPWLTRLPFPVHVVERLETHDEISRNIFASRYAYHHGFFDGIEREFRGFGMVEQWDSGELSSLSEAAPDAVNIEAASYSPPVMTKSWFHTGAYFGRGHISDYFAGLTDPTDRGEYYRPPGMSDADARSMLLEDTLLPDGLGADEEIEAARALKGAMLRREVFALDGTPREVHPYSATEQNFAVRLIQRRAGRNNAIFLVHPREVLEINYERDPQDPRVGHAFTLEVDEFGNVLKSAAVAYGRGNSDPQLTVSDRARQAQTFVTCSEVAMANAIDLPDANRAPRACEQKLFEITGVVPTPGKRFAFEDLAASILAAPQISFEDNPPASGTAKRLISHSRSYFRSNDLTTRLPLGVQQSQSLDFESYALTFTAGLVTQCFGPRVDDQMLRDQARYIDSEGGGWWSATGRAFFSPDPLHGPSEELDFARSHFFVPHRVRDPFGHETTTFYDEPVLIALEARDALGSRINTGQREWLRTDGQIEPARGGADYRVLLPYLVMDANGNRSEVAYNALGLVSGQAIMGKPGPANEAEGDRLGDDFRADLTPKEVADFAADPLGSAAALLGTATSRVVYDLDTVLRSSGSGRPAPAYSASISRETHVSDLAPNGESRLSVSISYSDGFSREIQSKGRAEPGPVSRRDAAGDIMLDAAGEPILTSNDVSPRWIASGWTIYDNKGAAVRQFDPFFTDSHVFEPELKVGVSPIALHDSLGRTVGTLHPDHNWDKISISAWGNQCWDANDTLLIADAASDEHVGSYFQRLPSSLYQPSWHALRTDAAHASLLGQLYPDADLRNAEIEAARRSEPHAATPSQITLDALGRGFLTSVPNRFLRQGNLVEELQQSRAEFDIQGNQLVLTDSLDRVVGRNRFNLLGQLICQSNMEAGTRWMLADAGGRMMANWDDRGHRFTIGYDELGRIVEARLLSPGSSNEHLIGDATFGEAVSDAEVLNLRGKQYKSRDQTGVRICASYDFKGNLLTTERRLSDEIEAIIDWEGLADPVGESWSGSTRFDALNRTIEGFAPDGSIFRPTYNEAGLLETLTVEIEGTPTSFVTEASHDAKGRRASISYGNGTTGTYEYDRLTSRLTRQTCSRGSEIIQDLHYSYDPIGNVTRIADRAQQDIYFANSVVSATSEYHYDALYRLIRAEGREHIGQGGVPETSWSDAGRVNHAHPHDGQALRRYSEEYHYDLAGNLLELRHIAPLNGSWTRTYQYGEASLLEQTKLSNRLSGTEVGSGAAEAYTYDAHGNMLTMPHLAQIEWDFGDRLARVDLSGGGTGHYRYDGSGQRVRKRVTRSSGNIVEERIYLGDLELFRRRGASGNIELERQTLHIVDDTDCIARIETRTIGQDPAPRTLTRYQLANHQGSVGVELDEQARILSYEEYYPYGATSFQSMKAETPKRYRFVGMERDEETGLSYHGARYYAPWLGRWLSPDPSGLEDGPNLYAYVACSPATYFDDDGCNKKKKKSGGSGATTPAAGGTPPPAKKKKMSLKQLRAIGKATERLWKDNLDTRPDTTNVIEQSKWKDKNTLVSSTEGGRFRQPDLAAERVNKPNVVVEVGAKPSTVESSQKEWQQISDDANIAKGNVVGDETKGYIKPDVAVKKGGIPVVDPGGNTALPGDPVICDKCGRQNYLADFVDIDLHKSRLAKFGKTLAKLGPLGTFVGVATAVTLIAEGKPLAAVKELLGAVPLVGDLIDLIDLGSSVFGWIFGGRKKKKKQINIDDYLTPLSPDEQIIAMTWDPEEKEGDAGKQGGQQGSEGPPDKQRWVDLDGLTLEVKRVKRGDPSAILTLPLLTGNGPLWEWDEYLLLDLALSHTFDMKLRGSDQGLTVQGRF